MCCCCDLRLLLQGQGADNGRLLLQGSKLSLRGGQLGLGRDGERGLLQGELRVLGGRGGSSEIGGSHDNGTHEALRCINSEHIWRSNPGEDPMGGVRQCVGWLPAIYLLVFSVMCVSTEVEVD